MSGSEMPLTADDRLAIMELLARWNLYEDRGDARAWAELFTVDGTSTSIAGKVLAGHEALEANAAARWEKEDARRSAHAMGAVTVTGTAERAHAEHYGVMISRNAGGSSGFAIQTHAVRCHEFRKENGQWRIFRRTIAAVPAPGKESHILINNFDDKKVDQSTGGS